VTRRAAIALALALGCGGGDDPIEPGGFIALTDDFRDFRAWPRRAVGEGELGEHPEGPRYVYANQAPPPAGEPYPVGTILVHAIEQTDDPMTWELFAMAKRGSGYNAAGAVGWEFFHLEFSTRGVPVIASRGLNPTVLRTYAGVGPITQGSGCNRCHAAPDAALHDSILSPLHRPGAAR
jgi:hypothetical protein